MARTKRTQSTWLDWVGADVVDETGDRIGELKNVYMDRGTGEPEWLAVATGFFGRNETFIPIGGADADGSALRVPHGKDFVKDAPSIDPDEGVISDEQEATLYRYYGRDDYRAWSDDESDITASTDRTATRKGGKGDAMTRSEEELVVDKQSHETGRARLRKYVVTENVTTTVPVRKEKVRIEREPITDENRDDAMSGADISEDEHEIVLSEEEVVTEKRTVPKERVRLDKDVEVDLRQVDEEVRKEQIDVER